MIRGLLIAGLFIAPVAAAACSLENAERVVSDDGVALLYRLESPPLALARHFSLQFRVCRDGTALSIENFRLDALMPAHRHGMNYRARVNLRADGLIEASGLLFHMPGHWRVVVDFRHQGGKRQFRLDFRV
jgi:hypothetical protein